MSYLKQLQTVVLAVLLATGALGCTTGIARPITCCGSDHHRSAFLLRAELSRAGAIFLRGRNYFQFHSHVFLAGEPGGLSFADIL